MKNLSNLINEWTLKNNSIKDIKSSKNTFIYYVDSIGDTIKVFDPKWPEFDKYKDKVYINGHKYELAPTGYTRAKFMRQTWEIYISDIENVENCDNMFLTCLQLKNVKFFNSYKATSMESMFQNCKHLEEVEFLNTSNVKNMNWMFCDCLRLKNIQLFNVRKDVRTVSMFHGCERLNEQTKKEWSSVYDFER